jgi:hypothetical protein
MQYPTISESEMLASAVLFVDCRSIESTDVVLHSNLDLLELFFDG